MKLWFMIRRPIGYTLFILAAIFALILIHALPVVITNAILGI